MIYFTLNGDYHKFEKIFSNYTEFFWRIKKSVKFKRSTFGVHLIAEKQASRIMTVNKIIKLKKGITS